MFLLEIFRDLVDNTSYKPGWPFITKDRVWTSPTIADVNNDGKLEIAITTGELGRLSLYLFDEGGKILPGWPVEMPDYYGVWGMCIYDHSSSPALGDIDGDSDLEIVLMSGSYLRAFHHNGTCVKGFPFGVIEDDFTQFTTPSLVDLDYDGDMEIITSSGAWLYAIQGNGELIWYWPAKAEPGSAYKSVSVGDIDNNGDLEIAVDGHPWCYDYYTYILKHNGKRISMFKTNGNQPTLADLDGDGSLEIIFSSSDKVNVIKEDGSQFPGWPAMAEQLNLTFPPSIGDIDKDSDLEIVVGSRDDNKIYAFHINGQMVKGFPISFSNNYLTPISIGDIDNDGACEILVGNYGGAIEGLNGDGSKVLGFPIKTKGSILSQPVVVDIDRDGKTEIIYGATKGGIYVLSSEGDPNNIQWQYYCNDQFHRGVYPKKKGSFSIDAPGMVEVGMPFSVCVSSYKPYSGSISFSLNSGTITPIEAFLETPKTLDMTIHSEGELLFIKAYDKDGNYGISNPIAARKDLIPPARIDDFKVKIEGDNSLLLSWTAPGDDGIQGTVAGYEIRYSTSTLDEKTWFFADKVKEEISPKTGGEKEEFILSGLNPNYAYWIGIKARDESGNESPISIATGKTTGYSISISPNRGNSGIELLVFGKGYEALTLVNIDFGTHIGISSCFTSDLGAFTCSFSITPQAFERIIVVAYSNLSKKGDFASFDLVPACIISGYIRNKNGNGIPDVSVYLYEINRTIRTYTDINGLYKLSAPINSPYVDIYPSRTGWMFIPSSRRHYDLDKDLFSEDFTGYYETDTHIEVYSSMENQVSVDGYGFGKNESIAIDFGEIKTIATSTSNPSGRFNQSFGIPTIPVGTKTITARGLSSGSIATRSFFVKRKGFVMLNLNIPPLHLDPFVAFGDYNNDGWIDLAICGKVKGVGEGDITRIYKNNNGKFIDSGNVFPGVIFGCLAWLDYDRDSDLDLVVTGSGWNGQKYIGKILGMRQALSLTLK
ncbi:MAG: FG-GAP-like repeat-containing protein [bacterium]